MTHAKFHFNRLMLTLIFGIRAWRTTEKAGPDRVWKKNKHLESSPHHFESNALPKIALGDIYVRSAG